MIHLVIDCLLPAIPCSFSIGVFATQQQKQQDNMFDFLFALFLCALPRFNKIVTLQSVTARKL